MGTFEENLARIERRETAARAEATIRKAVEVLNAIHGGEEFELLLCAPAGAVQPHAAAFVERFDLGLTRIGRVDEGEGVWMRDRAGREGRLHARSYDHFRVEG